jgi:hypothetical protein
MNMQHGHSAWKCSMDIQYRNAARKCSIDIGMPQGQAAGAGHMLFWVFALAPGRTLSLSFLGLKFCFLLCDTREIFGNLPKYIQSHGDLEMKAWSKQNCLIIL